MSEEQLFVRVNNKRQKPSKLGGANGTPGEMKTYGKKRRLPASSSSSSSSCCNNSAAPALNAPFRERLRSDSANRTYLPSLAASSESAANKKQSTASASPVASVKSPRQRSTLPERSSLFRKAFLKGTTDSPKIDVKLSTEWMNQTGLKANVSPSTLATSSSPVVRKPKPGPRPGSRVPVKSVLSELQFRAIAREQATVPPRARTLIKRPVQGIVAKSDQGTYVYYRFEQGCSKDNLDTYLTFSKNTQTFVVSLLSGRKEPCGFEIRPSECAHISSLKFEKLPMVVFHDVHSEFQAKLPRTGPRRVLSTLRCSKFSYIAVILDPTWPQPFSNVVKCIEAADKYHAKSLVQSLAKQVQLGYQSALNRLRYQVLDLSRRGRAKILFFGELDSDINSRVTRSAKILNKRFKVSRNEENQVIFTYPFDANNDVKNALTVRGSDLLCANNSEFLNDIVIDFYVKYLLHEHLLNNSNVLPPAAVQSRLAKVYAFSSLFFKRLIDANKVGGPDEAFASVRRWARRLNIFEYELLIFPVNDALHWTVMFLCNADQIVPRIISAARRASELGTDSLAANDTDASEGNELLSCSGSVDALPPAKKRSRRDGPYSTPESAHAFDNELAEKESVSSSAAVHDAPQSPPSNSPPFEKQLRAKEKIPAAPPRERKSRRTTQSHGLGEAPALTAGQSLFPWDPERCTPAHKHQREAQDGSSSSTSCDAATATDDESNVTSARGAKEAGVETAKADAAPTAKTKRLGARDDLRQHPEEPGTDDDTGRADETMHQGAMKDDDVESNTPEPKSSISSKRKRKKKKKRKRSKSVHQDEPATNDAESACDQAGPCVSSTLEPTSESDERVEEGWPRTAVVDARSLIVDSDDEDSSPQPVKFSNVTSCLESRILPNKEDYDQVEEPMTNEQQRKSKASKTSKHFDRSTTSSPKRRKRSGTTKRVDSILGPSDDESAGESTGHRIFGGGGRGQMGRLRKAAKVSEIPLLDARDRACSSPGQESESGYQTAENQEETPTSPVTRAEEGSGRASDPITTVQNGQEDGVSSASNQEANGDTQQQSVNGGTGTPPPGEPSTCPQVPPHVLDMDVELDEARKPVIVFMDSLKAHSVNRLKKNLLGYLQNAVRSRLPPGHNIPDKIINDTIHKEVGLIKNFRVPQQKTSFDCGVFVLQFIRKFVGRWIDNPASTLEAVENDSFFNDRTGFRPSEIVALREEIGDTMENLRNKWREAKQMNAKDEEESDDEVEIVLQGPEKVLPSL